MQPTPKLHTNFWLILMAVAMGLWIMYPYFLDLAFDYMGLTWRIDRRAQFGESFGALSALFTAWACILITWVLYLQRHEMRTHQATLNQMNEVLEEQTRAGRENAYIEGLGSLAHFHQQKAELLERRGDTHGSEHEWEEAQRRKQQLSDHLDRMNREQRW